MSRKPKVFNTLKLEDPSRGRFNLQLDPIEEDTTSDEPLVKNIHERFPGFFDCPEKCQPYKFDIGCEAYSAEDGFPPSLDLSAYYNGMADELKPREGMSIFATEYARLRGDFSDVQIVEPFPSTSEKLENYDQIEQENIKRIERMDEEEIQRSLKEIYERLDPDAIKFLTQRAKQKKEKPTVSLFKQRQQKAKANDQGDVKEENVEAKLDEKNSEFVKQLEVMSDNVMTNDEELNDYARLAMDPMHMDFATKYMKSVVSSQEKNLIRLFEKLRIPPRHYDGSDQLINLARSKMDQICELYLEEFVTQQGRKEKKFAKDVNPMVNSSWSLVPIRRVVDAQSIRGDSVKDDREIVELTLLWTVLLFKEQPTYFNLVHGVPGDIYCRLAELYLLGPEIFKEDIIEQCMDVLIKGFLIPKARDGKLSLKSTKAICGLDAFLPFYEDLLKHFLQFSYGDSRFSLFLLMAAYMNSSLNDALTMRCLLWTAATDVIRQMSITLEEVEPILEHTRKSLKETTAMFQHQFPDQMNALMSAYDRLIREGLITKERNPGVYQIAVEHLKFVKDS